MSNYFYPNKHVLKKNCWNIDGITDWHKYSVGNIVQFSLENFKELWVILILVDGFTDWIIDRLKISDEKPVSDKFPLIIYMSMRIQLNCQWNII
jgi:hypothetical protein